MPTFDIDAQVAASDPATIRFRGRDWALRSSIPMSLFSEFEGTEEELSARLSSPTGLLRFVEMFVQPEDIDAFRATDPTLNEVMAISKAITELSGMTPGESSASPGSS